MIVPPYLKKGDTVYIVAPAKAIDNESVVVTQKTLERWGLNVRISPHCLGRDHYFSGTDAARLSDFQWGLDAPEVSAIMCARGGYGCVRIMEQLSWERFLQHPKWLIGFSDITLFHHKTQQLGVQSIHGIMPLGFTSGSNCSKSTLQKSLFGESFIVKGPNSPHNISGDVTGQIIGGNMTLIYSLLGTPLTYHFQDKILFLEDVGEHIYKIDRMLYALRMSGAFRKIKGLILGGFTEMEDTEVPFGKTLEELILEQVSKLDIPVAFDFPIGHTQENQAITLGKTVRLTVQKTGATLFI